ncbi:MAG: cytochrome C biogenesis protein [Chloroflexi bacterium]|nr:cytochrome C biogenesis protein [Chloroflexota bacterium]
MSVTTTTPETTSTTQPKKRRLRTPYFQVVASLAWKDLRAEARGREMVNAMLLFSIMAVLIFSFALELDRQAQEATVGGVLWVTIAFAGTLGLGRSLAAEKDKGSLDALLLAPVERSALFYGKMIGNFLFTLAVGFLLVFLLTVLFNVNLFRPVLWLIIVLGCLGFATTGTLVASMSVHARAREMLLPILLLPIILPIIISATRASTALLTELKTEDWLPWIQLLGVVDFVFLLAGFFLFDFIVEE